MKLIPQQCAGDDINKKLRCCLYCDMREEVTTFKRLALGFLILATVAIGGVSFLSQRLNAANATMAGLYDTVENCASGKPLRIGTEVFRCVNATLTEGR